MSDDPAADLGLIARQQRMILADLAILRDDVPVLTAIAMRQDASAAALALLLSTPAIPALNRRRACASKPPTTEPGEDLPLARSEHDGPLYVGSRGATPLIFALADNIGAAAARRCSARPGKATRVGIASGRAPRLPIAAPFPVRRPRRGASAPRPRFRRQACSRYRPGTGARRTLILWARFIACAMS